MQQSDNRVDLISRLQTEIRQAITPIYTGGPMALVDFPNHSNVGDSAIWLGEIAFFRQHYNTTPGYHCTFANFDAKALDAAVPEGPVFIHGGGNFGDIYPHHHLFRERLMADLPHRKLVQLPQSIHFSSQDKLEQTARTIEKHRDFTLMVRDQESLELVQQRFPCAAALVPDMAFWMGALARPKPAEVDVFCLLRTDEERAGNAMTPPPAGLSSRVDDWIIEQDQLVRAQKLWGVLKGGLAGGFSPHARRFGMYETIANVRVLRGLKLLAGGKMVITDRLHSHILSLLMGIPHVALDNSYGKIARFAAAWTGGYTGLHRAGSLAEAYAVVAGLVRGEPAKTPAPALS